MVLVKKSVKEKLMGLDHKQRKAFIRELREKRKPNFKNAHKAKLIWEKLRSSKTSEEKKEELAQQLWEIVKGSASTLIFAHDTSRVCQALLVFGTDTIRSDLFDELTPELVRMSKSQYARYFVIKMLKHGTRRQREIIINSFFGHFPNLLQAKVSAKVVELIFNDYATAKQRFDIISEFYGKEFVLFRTENTFTSLQDVKERFPEKIEIIVKNLSEVLNSLTDKEQFALTICHKLLHDFFNFANKTEKLDMIESIKERLPEICHSKEGSDVCLETIWLSSVQDRKIIVKSFKGLALKLANDQFGRRVLFAIFDSVDDTILVNKILTKELADNVGNLIYDKWGVTVLHYIVNPRNVHVFSSGGLVKLLQKGDDNEFSKKKPADRYKQIFECMEPGLYSFLSANMRDILYNKTSAVLVLNALEPTGKDELMPREPKPDLKKSCFEKITDIVGEEFIPHFDDGSNEEKHISLGGPGCFVLKKLLKQDKNQPAVKLSESMARLPKEHLNLFCATNSGCFNLLHMAVSGSDAARKAVLEAINVDSLKKKTGFPGAQYLLEEVMK